jgi:hypothetical protein
MSEKLAAPERRFVTDMRRHLEEFDAAGGGHFPWCDVEQGCPGLCTCGVDALRDAIRGLPDVEDADAP